jgi:hypothetical protein
VSQFQCMIDDDMKLLWSSLRLDMITVPQSHSSCLTPPNKLPRFQLGAQSTLNSAFTPWLFQNEIDRFSQPFLSASIKVYPPPFRFPITLTESGSHEPENSPISIRWETCNSPSASHRCGTNSVTHARSISTGRIGWLIRDAENWILANKSGITVDRGDTLSTEIQTVAHKFLC